MNDMKKVASENHLRICNMSEVSNEIFDIGLSVNYNQIIPESILQHCKKGFYNIHHSYNMRLRGRNITTHAILNASKDKMFYHVTTLHKMVAKLDAGPIVASRSCTIESSDTAFSLFCKVDGLAYEMIKEWIPRIALQHVELYDAPERGVRYFSNKDLPSREIDIDMSGEDIYDLVRAFDFPGYAPAYMILNDRKVDLVVDKREKYNKKIYLKGYCFIQNIKSEFIYGASCIL